MRSPNGEESTLEPSVKSKTTIRSYTSMFRRRITKKSEANTRIKQGKQKSDEHYQADNASLLPRPSDVGTVDTTVRQSRYRVRRDIQSHIPDWIDDVVHARLMEIAERLAQDATNAETEGVWSPALFPDMEGDDEGKEQEDARPGSAPEASREEPYKHTSLTAVPRRSSVSAPSTRSMSVSAAIRSIVSPIDESESPIAPLVIDDNRKLEDVPRGEGKLTRHSRNLSSLSGASAISHGAGTSIYSKRSSTSSPGTSVEKRMSDALSTRMTWKDIARKTPIKKPVESGVLRKVNTHLAKPSTTYSIMSPVNAGVFDESSSPTAKPNNRYTVMSPVNAGVFDDDTHLNKPLPPDPTKKTPAEPATFFVMGEVVHSPPVPKSPELLRSVTFPMSPRMHSPKLNASPMSPKSPKFFSGSSLSSSPKWPQSAELPGCQPPDGFTAKKFARLSRPFSEPVFDFSEMPPLPEQEADEDASEKQHVELNEKFLVITEEPEGSEDQSGQSTGEETTKDRSMSPALADKSPSRAVSPAEANEDVTRTDSSAPPTPTPRVPAARSPTPSSVTSGRFGRESPALSRPSSMATQDDTVATGRPSPSPSPEPRVENQPVSTPTIAINSVPFANDETLASVSSPKDRAVADEQTVARQGEQVEEEHSQPDLEDEYRLSEPPSPTLSEAEAELMATLALDTAHKFKRPNSWLADSPTLGKSLTPLPRIEEVRPATALGNESSMDDAPKRKKFESHYAFLWSPDNGWYVA